MELVVSVRFLCCGNVENQVSLFLSRFRHVSWTEILRHFPVMFLSVDFCCCLFPLRFCKRISNLFALTKTTFTLFTRVSVAPNKPRLFGVIKFQSNANSKRKRKLPSRSFYIVLRLLIYVIAFQQNKEAERLLLTKKEVLFFENKKNQISAASTNGETRDGSMNLTFLTQLKQIFVKQFL